MFCKQCGKKVAPGTARCPHCGRSADVLSGGTGFWDLTTPPAAPAPAEIPTPAPVPVQIPEIPETPVIPQAPVERPAPIPPVEQEPRRPRKNPLRPLVLLLVLVALILVIALAITAVRAGRLSDQLEEANAALALQEAEAAQEQEAPSSAPVPSPVITPVPSEEPSPEPSPSEKPQPSEEPEPSEEPDSVVEAPEEAQPAGNGNVAENPASPLTAEFSEDMNFVPLTVEPGKLKVTEYQWVIVYDDALKTVEDCLEVLSETQLQEEPTVVKAMKDQVDPYDSSSGKATQKLDLTAFYPDHTAFGKRMFCKMTLEDGSVQCSQLVSPGPEAAKDFVLTRQRKDIVTAEVTLPETAETENISVSYLALEPRVEVSTADMQPYEPDFRLEIPLKEGGIYYVILGTGDAVYPITEAIVPEAVS